MYKIIGNGTIWQVRVHAHKKACMQNGHLTLTGTVTQPRHTILTHTHNLKDNHTNTQHLIRQEGEFSLFVLWMYKLVALSFNSFVIQFLSRIKREKKPALRRNADHWLISPRSGHTSTFSLQPCRYRPSRVPYRVPAPRTEEDNSYQPSFLL